MKPLSHHLQTARAALRACHEAMIRDNPQAAVNRFNVATKAVQEARKALVREVSGERPGVERVDEKIFRIRKR